MKLSHLRQIVEYASKYTHIKAIYRVRDSIIKIVFDEDQSLYVSLQKGNSYIAKCNTQISRHKVYSAAFDVVLAKRLNRSKIRSIKLHNDDKIVRIKVSTTGSYRHFNTTLQLEFTGKITNAILIDDDEIVLEALRHVESSRSHRIVKVSHQLLDPPPPQYIAKEYPLDSVEKFLYDLCKKEQHIAVHSLKKQKLSYLQKRLKKLESELSVMQSDSDLLEEAAYLQKLGELILANLHNIKPYTKQLNLVDYDDTILSLKLDREFSIPSNIAQYYFKRSKKLKQKALNSHVQRENLSDKIEHLGYFIDTVERATKADDIARLFPKKERRNRAKVDESIEVFWIDGYKIELGKNERGNIKLLQNAKAKDIWFHLRDRPSTHLFITTDKQSVPQKVIEESAKLCAEFSTIGGGIFEVDYTKRSELKIQSGANVLYNNYSTVRVNLS